MSAFEDEMRQAMASHDDEAPRAEDLLRSLEQAPPRRWLAGWYPPLAVAAAVVVVVAGSLGGVRLLGSRAAPMASHPAAPAASHEPTPAASQQPTGRVAPLACPARYAGQALWVPAKPAGVDGRARLVPTKTPSSALICADAGSNSAKQQTGWDLSGRRSLTGNLAGLAAQLSWKGRRLPGDQIACAGVGSAETRYLIGLRYSGGATVWVAGGDEADNCIPASNGEFTSISTIGPEAAQAFRSGRWPARPPAACSGRLRDIDRLGEDKALVPAGVISLTICTPKAHTVTSGYQALIRSLNRLPVHPSIGYCSGAVGSGAFYELLFTYAQGPMASVDITVGCHPEVENTHLQSASASTVMPIIQQLLKAT